MARLRVDNISINGDAVGFANQAEMFTEMKIIYSSNSVSTGNKSLSGTYTFSDFKAFLFGQYSSTTAYWSWVFMSRPVFEGIGGFYVQQNIATNDGRFKMNYVSDTSFNVSYVDNGGGIMIIGLN